MAKSSKNPAPGSEPSHKKGDKIDAGGGISWVFTEGGNWRKYTNGKKTDEVFRGKGLPTGATAPAAPGAAGPTGPDLTTPQGIAQAQQGINLGAAEATTAMNRVNEVTPYGSSQYTRNPDGTYTRTSSLSPDQQALYNKQQGLIQNEMGQVQQNFSQPLDYSGIAEIPGSQNLQDERKRIEDQIYGRQKTILDERFGREQQQLEQELADRGIPLNSELYNQSLQDFERRKNDTYSDALTQATQQGGAETERSFNLASQARNQGITERTNLRQNPYNELTALLQGQPQLPQFAPQYNTNVEAANITDPAIQALARASAEKIAHEQNLTQAQVAQLQGKFAAQLQAMKGEQDLANIGAQGQNQQNLVDSQRPNQGDILGQVGGTILGNVGGQVGSSVVSGIGDFIGGLFGKSYGSGSPSGQNRNLFSNNSSGLFGGKGLFG